MTWEIILICVISNQKDTQYTQNRNVANITLNSDSVITQEKNGIEKYPQANPYEKDETKKSIEQTASRTIEQNESETIEINAG